MVYISKKDAEKIIRGLADTSNEEIKKIIIKLKSSEKRIYVNGEREITKLIQKAFKEKRKLKIRYYSLHSDENTTRVIDVRQIHENCIVAHCHLREGERVFRIDRISSATILNEKYAIPKGWRPESIILDK